MKSKTTFMAATMSILASATLANADGFKKPEWFENARFGVFCHWGIQCTPEAGDWYGHNMYKEGVKSRSEVSTSFFGCVV